MAELPQKPSAWGGLAAILDTPAKRGIAIVAILAAMAVAPHVFGPYATVILTNALQSARTAIDRAGSRRRAVGPRWPHAGTK